MCSEAGLSPTIGTGRRDTKEKNKMGRNYPVPLSDFDDVEFPPLEDLGALIPPGFLQEVGVASGVAVASLWGSDMLFQKVPFLGGLNGYVAAGAKAALGIALGVALWDRNRSAAYGAAAGLIGSAALGAMDQLALQPVPDSLPDSLPGMEYPAVEEDQFNGMEGAAVEEVDAFSGFVHQALAGAVAF